MPDSLSPSQRLELSRVISDLSEPEFGQLKYALDPPNSVVPSNASAPGNRVIALLDWVEGPSGPGLGAFLALLDQIAPNAAFKTYSLSLFLHLQPHIEALAAAISTAYQLTCPLREDMSADLIGKLTQLQDAPRGASPYEAVDRFVALLSLSELNPEAALRQQLQQWLAGRVENVQSLLSEVQPQLVEHRTQQAADQISHLLIYVKASDSASHRSVSALLVRDGSQYDPTFGTGGESLQAPGAEAFREQVTLAELPTLVRACLDEARDKTPHDVMVHFILPLDWVNQACDRWSLLETVNGLPALDLSDIRLGEEVCCLLRLTDRLEPQVLKYFQGKWQKKWQTLTALPPAKTRAAFVLGDHLSPDKQLRAALNQTDRVGLKLSKVCSDSDYQKMFLTLITTGTPAAVWMRQEQLADGMCPVTDLDKLLACKIATLPENVKQCRSDAIAFDENAHIGHHLSFLWEDPNLIPPSTQASLQMPQP